MIFTPRTICSTAQALILCAAFPVKKFEWNANKVRSRATGISGEFMVKCLAEWVLSLDIYFKLKVTAIKESTHGRKILDLAAPSARILDYHEILVQSEGGGETPVISSSYLKRSFCLVFSKYHPCKFRSANECIQHHSTGTWMIWSLPVSSTVSIYLNTETYGYLRKILLAFCKTNIRLEPEYIF